MGIFCWWQNNYNHVIISAIFTVVQNQAAPSQVGASAGLKST